MGSPTVLRSRLPTRAAGLAAVAVVAAFLQYYLIPKPYQPLDELWDGDDTWPIRFPKEGWDISTDYPYPRLLEYDVSEGTWLRLDVHPLSGDIVFDMVGDIYCLPAHEINLPGPTKARPILLGTPHDSFPTFDDGGKLLAFTSDAETGLENIWVTAWKGCTQMDIRPSDDNANSDLLRALKVKDTDETLLANGKKETYSRRKDRLIREGRLQARRVTNETYRWVNSPRFHPSGSELVALRWMTPDNSDIGCPEIWEYTLPEDQEDLPQRSIPPRSGSRIVGRTLPAGMGPESYGKLHIGPEHPIWYGEDGLIYSKNAQEDFYHYGKDVHKGIYGIKLYNKTTGETANLVDPSPGGATRPVLSRDQRTLVFVRRLGDKEVLVLKDLRSGTINYAWDGLTWDLQTIHAPMGTYPTFAFTPEDDAIIIWAAGQIYRVPLKRNTLNERVSAGTPTVIPFAAHIEKRLAETMKTNVDLVSIETAQAQRVRSFKEMRVDDHGTRVVFQAAGVNVVQIVGERNTSDIPVLHNDDKSAYYSGSFVPGNNDLIIHCRWSNSDLTSFELAEVSSGVAYPITGLPFGKYIAPVISVGAGVDRHIAFVKIGPDPLTGDAVAIANPGIYVGRIRLPTSGNETSGGLSVTSIQFIPSDISLATYPANRIQMRFIDEDSGLLVEQNDKVFVVNISSCTDNSGRCNRKTVVKGKLSTEVAVAFTTVSGIWGKKTEETFAFVDFFNIYVVSKGRLRAGEELWSRPMNATTGLARVSLDGGHDISFSGDGSRLFWYLGPYLHWLELSKLRLCENAIKRDRETFGIDCVRNLVKYQEVHVEHLTDIARLELEAENASTTESANADVVVVFNATILTMETGELSKDYVDKGSVVMKGGVIDYVGPEDMLSNWDGATSFDAEGGLVIPGFIDVHAHWFGCFFSRFPSSSWELEAFLSWGVTTLHNPSANNVEAFAERSRVERGLALGSRIFSVGSIIYGSANFLHQDIIDMDAARSALTRIKVEGDAAALTYKNYGIPSRAQRQRLMLAGRNFSMLAVPEGGMNFDQDLTFLTDGMTTLEHSLPIPILYEDVSTLFALSGTGNTPTHLINYGGAFGEELVYRYENIPNHPKLRRVIPHSKLEALSETIARPANSYSIVNASSSVARMVKRGLSAHIGAHGEQPFGLNYHVEMAFAAAGGLSNYEVLQAATSVPAKTLGLSSSIGSVTAGKLADLLIYPPGIALVDGDISDTRKISKIIRGGRIYDADTMEEVWPVKGRSQRLPPLNP